MPRPGLPPLPHPSKWGQAFKRRAFLATRNGEREFYGRSILASPRIANQFVRALGIRKNEVIIESYPGPGVLTRALLAGGSSDPKVEQEQREAWRKEKANPTEVSKGLAEGFPQWLDYLTEADPPTGDLDGNENQRHKPKLVVSIEPTSSALRNGFGQDFADKVFPSVEAGTDSTIVQSAAEDRLVIAYNDPYTWQTFPAILEHPLVARNLPVFNSKSSEGPQVHRSFKDPEPPITFVATVPGHSSFDSFVSHLMNSSIGAGEGKPGYIWRYGRIRIALLCSKTLYDRLTAKPGETITGKLTIMARALFDIKPLPPYHHVPNVDKSSVSTEAQPFRASQKSPVAMAVKKAYDNTALPRTVTHLDDFHPKPYGAPKLANEDGAYKRPMMLGVLLTPKKTSVVKVEQQDEWDFVLRHLFVRQAQNLEKALPSLGFNAGSLQKDISSKGNLYAGKPVDCSKIVRDLDENEWARIVDVFANWPFKPDDLMLDKDLGLSVTAWDPTDFVGA